MKLSAKSEYACVAMVELAAQYPGGHPVSIKAIADSYQLSSGFLIQILQQLRGAGLVTSSRGSAGGYQLARSPDSISLLDVIRVVDGLPGESSNLDHLPHSRIVDSIRQVWQQIDREEMKILQGATLQELLERAQQGGGLLYQI